jgi:DHA2 family multidrug resistance protein
MAGALNNPAQVQATMMHSGMTANQALAQLDNLTQSQAVMLGTNQMFLLMTVGFVIAACAVWLSPKPKLGGGPPGAGGGH